MGYFEDKTVMQIQQIQLQQYGEGRAVGGKLHTLCICMYALYYTFTDLHLCNELDYCWSLKQSCVLSLFIV